MRRPVVIRNFGISQFFQLPFNVYLAKTMPLPILRCYMYLWGLIYVTFRIQMLLRIATCLSLIYKIEAISLPFLIGLLKSLFGVFEHYFEKMVMAYKTLDELQHYLSKKLMITNKYFLDRLQSQGKGALLVTGHFGAVEYLPLSLAMQGYKVSMICKFKTQTLKKALTEKAAKFGVQLIDASEPGVALKALRAIRQGRFLITECDEFSEWRFHKSQRVSVFGMTLPRDRTIDFFFKKAKAPTFLVLMKREQGRINMVVEFLANGQTDASVAVTAWKTLEKHIFLTPHQWYQLKGAARFLLNNSLGPEDADRKDKSIPDKDSVLRPSYT